MMNKKTMDTFRNKLLNMRADLLKSVKNNKEGEKDFQNIDVGDAADIASNSYEREFLFELNDMERQLMRDIDRALHKIDIKTYGNCEHCKGKINEERLEALPFAPLCISCQSIKESQ